MAPGSPVGIRKCQPVITFQAKCHTHTGNCIVVVVCVCVWLRVAVVCSVCVFVVVCCVLRSETAQCDLALAVEVRREGRTEGGRGRKGQKGGKEGRRRLSLNF